MRKKCVKQRVTEIKNRNTKLMRGEKNWRSCDGLGRQEQIETTEETCNTFFIWQTIKSCGVEGHHLSYISVSGSRCHRSQMTDVIHLHSYHTNKTGGTTHLLHTRWTVFIEAVRQIKYVLFIPNYNMHNSSFAQVLLNVKCKWHIGA